MSTNVDVQISVSSNGAVTVKKDLDAIGQSAEGASNKANNLKAVLASNSAAPSFRQASLAMEVFGTSAVNVTNKINSAGTAFGTFGRASQQAAATAQTSFAGVLASVDSVAPRLTSVGNAASAMVSKLAGARGAVDGLTPVVTKVGQASQASSFNVANLAAQFNDIGVTAAMSMSPLQIALQQGTQISQVFGNVGAAGAVKMLGSAFMSIISPVALATIGIVAGVAALIQHVNWTKVWIYMLKQVGDAAYWLRNNMDTLRPVLIAAGAALILAFGPAALGAVWSLTTAINVGLINAVKGLFALLMRNPFVAFAAIVVTGLIYIIEKMATWKRFVAELIKMFGELLEIIGRVTKLFDGGWLENKGIQIQINADKAASQLIGALDNGTNKLLKGVDSSTDKMRADMKKSMADAGKDAGTGMKDIFLEGSTSAGQGMADAFVEGTTPAFDTGVQSIKGGIIDGFDSARSSLQNGIEDSFQMGGESASGSIQDAFMQGGSQVGNDILNAFQAGAVTFSEMASKMRSAINAQINEVRSKANLNNANALKSQAEAQAIAEDWHNGYSNYFNKGSGGSGSSNKSSSSLYLPKMPGFANGGAFEVGGNGSGRDKTPVSFRANRGERVSVETRRQQQANDRAANNNSPVIEAPVDITNVFDLDGLADTVTDTERGRRKILNMMKINREEILEILGSY